MKFLKNVGGNAMKGLIATGGGCVARVVENNLEKVPGLGTMKMAHKALVFLLGAALADNKTMHYGGVGAMAVMGTDFISGFVPMVKGINDDTVDELNGLADELADELEESLKDDVSNAQAAMNDDVSSAQTAMNDQF